jgi:hypothetical protein
VVALTIDVSCFNLLLIISSCVLVPLGRSYKPALLKLHKNHQEKPSTSGSGL